MKIWWHKVKNWEYWSANFIYMPTFFYWIWLMVKFRSVSFYKYSNTGIKNGGLYGDSKYDIYQLFPQAYYPKTILIKGNKKHHLFNILLQEHQLHFPLILKPDIGLRGIGVQKVNSVEEIEHYHQRYGKDFLIQQFVDLPNEIGLFYTRFPNEKKGKITGITIKNFLTLEGNGKETIEELLRKNPRFEMQIPKLRSKINLQEILPEGEKKCLVPYGNHNLGTEFKDGKGYITEKLEKVFDEILSKVQGFNYGRLDIRYQTLEELEQGQNFCIIELNGAKSEPTHIYDPKHGFYFGQKEIFRHQKILQEIVRQKVQA